MKFFLFIILLFPTITYAQLVRPPTILTPPVKPTIPLEPGWSKISTVTVVGTYNSKIDTKAVQDAIDSVTYTPGDTRQGCVILRGKFAINKTLQCGRSNTRSVAIHGDGEAFLSWRGPVTSDYMFKFEGYGRNRITMLKNIRMYCWWKCRGVLMVHQAYRRVMESCHIYKTREIGVDLIDCWGSNVQNCMWTSVFGVALRVRGGGMRFADCRFAGYGTRHKKDTTMTHELNKYQQEFGIALTKEKYGKDYIEMWPDPDDQTVKRYNGTLVQTKLDTRCMVDVRCGATRFVSMMFEADYYGGYPLVITSLSRETWQDTYCELVYAKCIWRVDGFSKHNALQWGLIDNVSLATGKNPVTVGNQLEYLVIANKSHTAGLTIRRIGGSTIRKGILLLDGGVHWRPKVEDVGVWYSGETPGWRTEFPMRQWIVNKDAVVHSTVPVGRSVTEK